MYIFPNVKQVCIKTLKNNAFSYCVKDYQIHFTCYSLFEDMIQKYAKAPSQMKLLLIYQLFNLYKHILYIHEINRFFPITTATVL